MVLDRVNGIVGVAARETRRKEQMKNLIGVGTLDQSSRQKHRARIVLALGILILLALTTSQTIEPASAQSGGGYDLTWNSIDGGGAMYSMGGTYSLGGTIGQADAGTMSGGAYTLNGGFWVDIFGNKLYLPLIVR